MELKKIVVASIFFLLMITLGAVFGPFSEVSASNTLRTLGTIEQVLQTRSNEVVFKLKDDDKFYYIEKESQKDLSVTDLQKELSGKSVEIYYVKRWTPIDPLRVNHITKVDLNKMTLYTRN
jgi:hypothetical protein